MNTLSLSFVGMALIILSWIIQIGFTLKSSKTMLPAFAGLQLLGIALLVFDSFSTSGTMGTIAWLNVGSALGALIMLILVAKK